MHFKPLFVITVLLTIFGCTTGQLHYIDAEGNRKLACDVEFVGLPSVDKYAVEYALSICAKSAVKRGYKVEQPELLDLDTTIKLAPCGKKWNHDLAKKAFRNKTLSKQEYGYIVAHIDLGLAKVNQCDNNLI
jgi:hypothetical protein